MLMRDVGRIVLQLVVFVAYNAIGQAQPAETFVTSTDKRGVFPDLHLEQMPSTLWTFRGVSISEVVSFDNVVYLRTEAADIVALAADSGEALWKTTTGTSRTTGLTCSRNPDFDYLIVSHYDGIAALERHSGAILWNRELSSSFAGPEVIDTTIFAAGSNGKAYAFDLDTGRTLWESDFLADAPPDPPGFPGERARFGDQASRPRQVVSDGESIFFSVFDQCRVIALDVKTGQRRWAFQTAGWILGRPVVTDSFVLIGSQDKHLYCIDKATGKEVWKFRTDSRVEASPAVGGSHVYAGSCDANVYCLELATGSEVWRTPTQKRATHGGPIYEQGFLAGHDFYIPTMEGTVYGMDARTGKINWRMRPSEHSEIDDSFSDGERLFIKTRQGINGQGEVALFAIGNANP